jgi:hypothetical protein
MMDLGAELTAQLLESRADAESLMLDTCTIGDLGDPDTDPDTGEVIVPLEAVVYPDPSWPDDHPWKHGPCKVKPPQRANQPTDVGEGTVTVTPGEVHIPAAGPDLKVGQVVDIAASQLSPTLVGDRYRIIGPFDGTFITARRYPVEFA